MYKPIFVRTKTALIFWAGATFFGAASSAPAQDLSAGYRHTCAIDAGAGVRCWGDNTHGQLGDGSRTNRALPVRVKHLESGVVAVTASSYRQTCALRANGEVLCWGDAIPGEGGYAQATVPSRVPGLGPGSGVTAITNGDAHGCALKSNGALLCWGWNEYGQVGIGTSAEKMELPSQVVGFGPGSGIVAVAAGYYHTCAVKSDQSVYCWGLNNGGQLGDGTTISRTTNTAVRTLGVGSGVIDVWAGVSHTCVTRTDGAVLCWGGNGSGQIGNGIATSAVLSPSLVVGSGGTGSRVSGGFFHTCARVATGSAYCWGFNGHGQLGDGSFAVHYLPVPVLTLDAGVDAVATGQSHSCARQNGKTVVCWGNNEVGQLGIGRPTGRDINTPEVVALYERLFADGFDD